MHKNKQFRYAEKHRPSSNKIVSDLLLLFGKGAQRADEAEKDKGMRPEGKG